MSDYSEPSQDCQWSDRNDVSPFDYVDEEKRAEMERKFPARCPWQMKRSPSKYNKNHWGVYQGSAQLGSFWMGNGTIYANTTNQGGESLEQQLLGHDIGWMDTSSAAQWVYDRYHELRSR